MAKQVRNPIQLVAVGVGVSFALYAVCDDGTIWCLMNNQWSRVTDIPQSVTI